MVRATATLPAVEVEAAVGAGVGAATTTAGRAGVVASTGAAVDGLAVFAVAIAGAGLTGSAPAGSTGVRGTAWDSAGATSDTGDDPAATGAADASACFASTCLELEAPKRAASMPRARASAAIVDTAGGGTGASATGIGRGATASIAGGGGEGGGGAPAAGEAAPTPAMLALARTAPIRLARSSPNEAIDEGFALPAGTGGAAAGGGASGVVDDATDGTAWDAVPSEPHAVAGLAGGSGIVELGVGLVIVDGAAGVSADGRIGTGSALRAAGSGLRTAGAAPAFGSSAMIRRMDARMSSMLGSVALPLADMTSLVL